MALAQRTEPRTKALRSCEAAALAHSPSYCGCRIQPAWDGSGGYVLWALPGVSGRRGRQLLVHEDGAPLRFPDPVKAQAHALKCGFRPQDISVRWPP